jgi:hypothetical protein
MIVAIDNCRTPIFRDPDGHPWEIIWNPPTENTTQ